MNGIGITYRVAFGVACLGAAGANAHSSEPAALRWITCDKPRFGYEICCPRQLLPPQPETDLFSLIMTDTDAAPLPATYEATIRPCFDCTKASSEIEAAICSRNELPGVDSAIAQAYRKLRVTLDPRTMELPAQDQQDFVKIRHWYFALNNRSLGLLDSLKRAKLLDAIKVPATADFADDWSRLMGGLDSRAESGGSFHVSLDVADSFGGNWVCQAEGEGKIINGILSVTIATDQSGVAARRDGQALKVAASDPQGSTNWQPEYCGQSGSLNDNYFATSVAP